MVGPFSGGGNVEEVWITSGVGKQWHGGEGSPRGGSRDEGWLETTEWLSSTARKAPCRNQVRRPVFSRSPPAVIFWQVLVLFYWHRMTFGGDCDLWINGVFRDDGWSHNTKKQVEAAATLPQIMGI